MLVLSSTNKTRGGKQMRGFAMQSRATKLKLYYIFLEEMTIFSFTWAPRKKINHTYSYVTVKKYRPLIYIYILILNHIITNDQLKIDFLC